MTAGTVDNRGRVVAASAQLQSDFRNFVGMLRRGMKHRFINDLVGGTDKNHALGVTTLNLSRECQGHIAGFGSPWKFEGHVTEPQFAESRGFKNSFSGKIIGVPMDCPDEREPVERSRNTEPSSEKVCIFSRVLFLVSPVRDRR